MSFRTLVCGGRQYDNLSHVFHILDKIHAKYDITHIIHGGASGADNLAGQWAKHNQVNCFVFYAQWNKLGKSAGFERNARMLQEGKPDCVIAFPGGAGTQNMISLAEKNNIKLWVVE